MPLDGRDLIWWAGPHSWENEEVPERMAKRVLSTHGVTRLLFVVDGSLGFGLHMLAAARKLGIPVLELKPDYELWNRRAIGIRDAIIASLPVDQLYAVHYLDLNDLNHREVRAAIVAANAYSIPTRTLQVSPALAMPSVTDFEAAKAAKRKRAPRKRA